MAGSRRGNLITKILLTMIGVALWTAFIVFFSFTVLGALRF